MLIAILILTLILIVCIVLALASWGVTTSATGLTLAAGNTALAASNATLAQANTTAQTTITFLVVMLVGLVLVIVFGAPAVFITMRQRESQLEQIEAHHRELAGMKLIAPRANEPIQVQAVPAPLQLPAPQQNQSVRTPLQLPTPNHTVAFGRTRPGVVRVTTRKRRSSNQAAHVAATWFNHK